MGRLSDAVFGGDLFANYPATPGWRDPDTSRKAADEMHESAASLRGLVLAELKLTPSSVHAMAEKLGKSVPSIQPRFSELVAAGKIRWTGETEKNKISGKAAKIWRAI